MAKKTTKKNDLRVQVSYYEKKAEDAYQSALVAYVGSISREVFDYTELLKPVSRKYSAYLVNAIPFISVSADSKRPIVVSVSVQDIYISRSGAVVRYNISIDDTLNAINSVLTFTSCLPSTDWRGVNNKTKVCDLLDSICDRMGELLEEYYNKHLVKVGLAPCECRLYDDCCQC